MDSDPTTIPPSIPPAIPIPTRRKRTISATPSWRSRSGSSITVRAPPMPMVSVQRIFAESQSEQAEGEVSGGNASERKMSMNELKNVIEASEMVRARRASSSQDTPPSSWLDTFGRRKKAKKMASTPALNIKDVPPVITEPEQIVVDEPPAQLECAVEPQPIAIPQPLSDADTDRDTLKPPAPVSELQASSASSKSSWFLRTSSSTSSTTSKSTTVPPVNAPPVIDTPTPMPLPAPPPELPASPIPLPPFKRPLATHAESFSSVDTHVPALLSETPSYTRPQTPIQVLPPTPPPRGMSMGIGGTRMGMGIPLLGRRKVMGEGLVKGQEGAGNGAKGDSGSTHTATPTASQSLKEMDLSSRPPSPPIQLLPSNPPPSQSPPPPLAAPELTPSTSTAGWINFSSFNFFGSTPSTPAPDVATPVMTDEAGPTPSDAATLPAPLPTSTTVEETINEAPLEAIPPTTPGSTASDGGPSSTAASSWVNALSMPWLWSASNVPSTVPEEEVQEQGGEQAMTEAEKVKHAALARLDPSPAPPPSAPSDVQEAKQTNSTGKEGENVLMSNPAARASWVSFFSSNSALKGMSSKRIEGANKEEEEVMTLDIEPEGGTSTTKEGEKSNTPTSVERPKEKPQAPLTDNKEIKKNVTNPNPSTTSIPDPTSGSKPNSPIPSPSTSNPPSVRSPSPSSSKAKKVKEKEKVRRPNLILPTFEDTFDSPPRSTPPPKKTGSSASGGGSVLRSVTGYLLGVDLDALEQKGKGKEGMSWDGIGDDLPRRWSVLESQTDAKSKAKGKGKSRIMREGSEKEALLRGCKRVVVIGVHGWFPGTLARSVIGAPTGTSAKFASMMRTALISFVGGEDVLENVTSISLEGEGVVESRVEKLYQNLLANTDWLDGLHQADVIFVATHSQGCIASTELLDRLLSEGHINPKSNSPLSQPAKPAWKQNQRVCLLGMCGIHLGPLQYLTGSLVGPYIQYFESAAATELFEFQDTDSEVSKRYVGALGRVLDSGVKFVYIASLNDQVVPIYSGLFATANHPSILRALYIDGDAYSSSDFLSNLLVLLLKMRNAGLDDNGLLAHLSEATAGSLNGIGHSSAYEEPGVYSLAVRYLFKTSGSLPPAAGVQGGEGLQVEKFTAKAARNDYEIPWALREVIAHESGLFEKDWQTLARAFEEWQPRTTILRDMKRKLQPIQRLRKSRL